MFWSEKWLAYWRARIHDQETLTVLDNNIQRWTKQVHYFQSLVEKTQKKKATIDIQNLDNLAPPVDAEVNLGIEQVVAARSLEKELRHFKALDL